MIFIIVFIGQWINRDASITTVKGGADK